MLNIVWNFIKNPDFSFKEKTVWFVGILVILLSIDISFSVSHYIFYSNKVEHLKEINDLKIKHSNNSELLIELNRIEKKAINKRTPYEYLYSYFFDNSSNKSNNAKTNTTPTNTNNTIDYIHLFTSSLIWILALLIIPVSLIFTKKFNGQTLVGAFFVVIVLIVIIFLYSYFLGLIPPLFGNQKVNYGLNVFVQGLTIFGLSKIPNNK